LKDGEPYTVKTYGVVADLVAVIQMQQRRMEARQMLFELRMVPLLASQVRNRRLSCPKTPPSPVKPRMTE